MKTVTKLGFSVQFSILQIMQNVLILLQIKMFSSNHEANSQFQIIAILKTREVEGITNFVKISVMVMVF